MLAQMTQEEVAAKISEPQNVISDLELNKYEKPSAELVAKLAHCLNSTSEYVLDGVGPERISRLDLAEHELLAIYRHLDGRDRIRLLRAARTYLDDNKL